MSRMFKAFLIALAGAVVVSIPAQQAADEIPFPDGFRNWFAVNSMVVTKVMSPSVQLRECISYM